MEIKEYGSSVLNKATHLLKDKLVVLEYPITRKHMLIEGNQWRFFILYGKDNGKENGYYVDRNGDYGNRVIYIMRKDLWVCTCMHYIHSLDENCKHICASKLLMQKQLEDAKNSEVLNETGKSE